MKKVRILLADSQTIVRQGIKSLLDKEPDIHVVAEAHDGESLLELARACRPDIIVTEIQLPGMSGIEATRRIVAEGLASQVLLLTGNGDRASVVNGFGAGARGYILKDTDSTYLLEGIRTVHLGEKYLDPWVSEIMECNPVAISPKDNQGDSSHLTPREQEILRLVAEGNSSKGIAFILGISNKTVDTFRRQCMKKLQLNSNAELTKYALRKGLIHL